VIATGRKQAIGESLREHIRKLRNGQIGNQRLLKCPVQIAESGRGRFRIEGRDNHVPDEMRKPGHAKGKRLGIVYRFGFAGEKGG